MSWLSDNVFKPVGSFLFGETSNDWDSQKNDLFSKLANRDNRARDFDIYSGQAINDLAGRGVINSSVGSDALAKAASLADQNYWNDQMTVAQMVFGQQPQQQPGALQGVLQGAASALPLLFI